MFIGPMFAGKTCYIVMELTRMADLGYRVLYINHRGDDRTTTGGDPGVYTTHSSTLSRISTLVNCITAHNLKDVDVSQYDVIGVDEANFYSDLLTVIPEWVNKRKLHVYVSGLDGDYLRRPLGDVLNLLPYADTVEKISSKCTTCLQELRGEGFTGTHVGCNAPFTARIVNSTDTVLIGGSESYRAVCRRHYELMASKTEREQNNN